MSRKVAQLLLAGVVLLVGASRAPLKAAVPPEDQTTSSESQTAPAREGADEAVWWQELRALHQLVQQQQQQIQSMSNELKAFREGGVQQANYEFTGEPERTPAHNQADLDRLIESRVSEVVESRLTSATSLTPAGGGQEPAPRFESGYDRGFFIRPTEAYEDEIPFDLLVKGRMQFRHTGFKSDMGTPGDRNDFEVERGRLIFRGHFIDPKLGYYIQMDADDDDNFDVKFHDAYLTYELSKAAAISWGKWKVPGSRDWLQSSQRSRFADRSMATTFFRPDRTTGVWLHGEPAEDVHYRLMVGNGFWTTDMSPSQIDDQFGFAATLYWDPLGDFGQGYSDLECHPCPVVRVGNSFTFSDIDPTSSPGELTRFRLVDSGTLLTDAFPGASGAAAGFDVAMYAVDAAFKYRGWSANAEYFFRWLYDFEGAGVPIGEIFDHGFYAEAGYFIVPERLELIGRMSRVTNDGGSPSADEYAAGFNYFVKGHNLKLTFDVSTFNGSPAQNSSVNIRAGDDGVMFRTQVEAAF